MKSAFSTMKIMATCLTGFCLPLMSTGTVLAADVLLQPTAIAFCSSENIKDPDRQQFAVNVINGSGMSDNPATKLSTHNGASSFLGGSFFWPTWITTDATSAVIVFDLGAEKNISEAVIWNYQHPDRPGRGARNVDIYTSSASVHSSATYTKVTSIVCIEDGANAQVFPCVANNVRLIKFDIKDNCGDGIYVGLSEVRFTQAATTPVIFSKTDFPHATSGNFRANVLSDKVDFLINSQDNYALALFDLSGRTLWNYAGSEQKVSWNVPVGHTTCIAVLKQTDKQTVHKFTIGK